MGQPEYQQHLDANRTAYTVASSERLPESTRIAICAGVFLVVAYGFVGTLDYQIAVADANERLERRPAGKLLTEREARLWSKRCMEQGKQIFATQADGGRWKVQCVNAEVRS